MDKCKYCDKMAEYKCLVEDEESPMQSHVEDICSDCREKVKHGLIEVWTLAEWEQAG